MNTNNYEFIQAKNFNEARKKIREFKKKGKKIIFSSSNTNDDLNRKVIEKEPVDVLLINLKERKDFQKQRNSGFNHVLAKIAKKNKIKIGINFDEILQANSSKEKAEILSRIMQNIKLCNKNKLKMKFISIKGFERDLRDLKSLGIVLGMPTWMISQK